MPPEIDGLKVCKDPRHTGHCLAPVLISAAKDEESDTVIGLELGADGYVIKPFNPEVLITRVKALFRRLERTDDPKQTSYGYGPLLMDLSRHEALVNGTEVPLTAKEFGPLEQLVRRPGQVLTRDVLLNAVWGYDYYGTTRTVDVHIRRLKLKIPLLDDTIISVKSLGYKLSDQIPER